MDYFIGVDIGGTNIRACVIDEENNIVDKFKIKNEVSAGPIDNIENLYDEINKRWNSYDIKALGVACPGPLDLKNGIIINPPNLIGWENFPIKNFLQDKFKLPVIVNNDANVAGFGEAMVGVAKDCESVYYITLSTGVGGGFIYKGEIVNGFNNIAAEINNMIINEDTYSHSGLNKGGLEGQCSGVNISRIASEKLHKEFSTKDVFEHSDLGDKVCQEIIDNWVLNISKAIANIIVIVDPETIVLGGSVILNNSKYINKIIDNVKNLVFKEVNVDIRLAELGDDAGLIGCGVLSSTLVKNTLLISY